MAIVTPEKTGQVFPWETQLSRENFYFLLLFKTIWWGGGEERLKSGWKEVP